MRIPTPLRTTLSAAAVLAVSVHSQPGKVLDLSAWKVTLPVTEDGEDGPSRKAAEIRMPGLATFEQAPWLRDTTLGGVRAAAFRAHADGAKTSSNTKFARCELREMVPSPYANAAWRFGDGKAHVLTLTQAVTALPLERPQTAAGQIHDADNDVFMLKCIGRTPGKAGRSARLVAFTDDASREFPIEEDYTLGTFFTLAIQVSPAGRLTVLYDGKATGIADYGSFPRVKELNPTLAGMYFKAGCYIQSNVVDYGEKPDAYAEVVISGSGLGHGGTTGLAAARILSAPTALRRLPGLDLLGRIR